MSLAPIVLFVFNRPWHTQRTLDSLKKNLLAGESELFVFSDGPRNEKDEANVEAVRALIKDVEGFKTVTLHTQSVNHGLANSVIEGVSKVIRQYDKVIVIEDDLQFSPHFLSYMNAALANYEGDQRVFSIGGYSPPLQMPEGYEESSYLSYRCCTWGWGTWRDRWDRVDWDIKDFQSFCKNQDMIARFNRGGDDMFQILKQQMAGRISSWGIRWDYAHFKNEAYCFRPTFSIVGNTGNDGTGIHCGVTSKFDVPINMQSSFVFPEPGRLELNDEINRRFASFYDGRQRGAALPISSLTANASALKKLMGRMRKLVLG